MPTHEIERHEFEAPLTCRYLLDVPQDLHGPPLLVMALHGYSANPDDMLRLARIALGDDPIVASLQAPYQHYVASGLPDNSSVPGYNWGISRHWDSAVHLHHTMLLRVLEDLNKRFHVPAERRLLMGFSQPVGLNYRFVATHPGEVRGVIGVCGGVPRDWEDPKYKHVHAALLHISRDEDPFYPAGTANTFASRLRHRATDVEFHMLPGPHRFPSKAAAIIRPWTKRIFGD
jgi:predicted esterase